MEEAEFDKLYNHLYNKIHVLHNRHTHNTVSFTHMIKQNYKWINICIIPFICILYLICSKQSIIMYKDIKHNTRINKTKVLLFYLLCVIIMFMINHMIQKCMNR